MYFFALVATEADKLRATKPDELLIYVRHWRPNDFILEDPQEVCVDDTAGDLIAKVVNFAVGLLMLLLIIIVDKQHNSNLELT